MSIAELTDAVINSENRNPEKHIFQMVSSVGDGTGVTELNAAAPADYMIKPKAGEIYVLKRLNLWQIDANFNSASGYGAGSALTNGIGITVENGLGVIKNYTPLKIKTTYEWSLLAGVDASTSLAAGADVNLVRWTFAKGGGNIVLNGTKGEFLKFSFGDAMNFMTNLRIQVQGYIK